MAISIMKIRQDPWLTIRQVVNIELPITVEDCLLNQKEMNHSMAVPEMPTKFTNLSIKMSWSTVSYASLYNCYHTQYILYAIV